MQNYSSVHVYKRVHNQCKGAYHRSEGVVERDISSLGVIGWGAGGSWKILPPLPPPLPFFPPPPISDLFVNMFFTNGLHIGDLAAILPRCYS